MSTENERAMDAVNESPSKKITAIHKRMIEEKLRELKQIRVAYSRFD